MLWRFQLRRTRNEQHIQESLLRLLKMRQAVLQDLDSWIGTLMDKLSPEAYHEVTIEALARLKQTDPGLAEWVYQNFPEICSISVEPLEAKTVERHLPLPSCNKLLGKTH